MWEGSGMEGVAMQCGGGGVRDGGCGHAVWEESGTQGWRVWPCSEGGVRDGGCGHAVWEGSGKKGVAMQCGPPFITDDVNIGIIGYSETCIKRPRLGQKKVVFGLLIEVKMHCKATIGTQRSGP